VLETLDAAAVRRWCDGGLEALRAHQREIDDLNVYPVPDGDTGTNLVLTLTAAHEALEPSGGRGVGPGSAPSGRGGHAGHGALPGHAGHGAPSGHAGHAGHGDDAGDDEMAGLMRRMARGALLGARGNSGVIVSQILRGMADTFAGVVAVRGSELARALRTATDAAYAAVARPVEGTVLSVVAAAAEAAGRIRSDSLIIVARAAANAATEALARTPQQLPVLAQAGVVDAGGRGLCLLLDALVEAIDTRDGALVRLEAGDGASAGLEAGDGALVGLEAGDGASAGLEAGDGALVGLEAGDGALVGLEAGDGALVGLEAGDGASAGLEAGDGTPEAAGFVGAAPRSGGGGAWADVLTGGGAVEAGGGAIRPLVVAEGSGVVNGTAGDGTAGHGTAGLGPARDAGSGGGAGAGSAGHVAEAGCSGYGFEVQYLLDATEEAVERLRATLDRLGESLVVVGTGDGDPPTWNVHVHVTEVGPAIEAGIVAGRPYRINVTLLEEKRTGSEQRGAVVVAAGDGLTALFEAEGAVVVDRNPSTAEMVAAVHGTGARAVVLLPNDANTHAVAVSAAREAENAGVRVSVVPTRSPVQALAALAVRDVQRPFADDVIAMAEAAGACRYGEVCTAQRDAFTVAGQCRAGDLLGLVDGEVHVIGQDVAEVSRRLLDRMLGGGGELVTLVLGADAPPGFEDALRGHVHRTWPFIEVQCYAGGQPRYHLLAGVE
jgi:dihydroxyacetone kinase-like predicted kinase